MYRTCKTFMCDFETTVYKGQVNTEVWASASVELFTEDVLIFHSIEEQFNYFLQLDCNIRCYYHNLKFDGSFWLSYLLVDLGYKQAFNSFNDEGTEGEWLQDKFMPNKSIRYSISEKGQWYSITIKVNSHIIEIRDSLKLLPFSVAQIGKSFKTKHQKLDMEYTGFRYAGCEITAEEKRYIANDVLVVKEALEIMFTEGHNKLTIGACCLEEYKKIMGKYEYELFFPRLENMELDPKEHTYRTVDEWIRKSYRGGWCYLVKGKENKIYEDGTTADVNSLYPSVMSSESGNKYPVNQPHFWKGNYIPDEALLEDRYYFIRVKTRFYIKDGYLPFIQIKNRYMYVGNECLESTDVYDTTTGKYYSKYYLDGVLHDTRVELTWTMTDYELIKEHYDLVDFEIIDGCWFRTEVGIFDMYINKYKKIKLESKGAKRESAKLFLNNLYGKMASNTDSSFKVAFIKEDKSLGFYYVHANEKDAGFIAVGSAITSYARDFTIRTAQKNYHGKNKRGFIYADTDSIHCDLKPEEITGIRVHDKDFCCWKLESSWDKAIFTRQKTYIEHVVAENLQPIDEPYYNVKCAGMPTKCKDLFIKSITNDYENLEQYTEEERGFIMHKRTLKDFKVGLKIPGKLMPKRIPGGVLLVDTTYEMR